MEESQRPKQAACLVCRRSKIKCDFSPAQVKCKRCIQLDVECVRPTFHAGRQKGIKNKRKGLEKAIYQIEQAIKRARSGEQSSDESKALGDLRQLLGSAGDMQTMTGFSSSIGTGSGNRLKRRSTAEDEYSSDDDDETEDTPESNTYITHHREGSLTVDDAENPLQLLARASNLQLSPTPGGPSPGQAARASRKKQQDRLDEDAETQSFFTSIRVNLDVGDDIDPIHMGLTTEAEAVDLFDYFHKHLAHTRWGLDPEIYTVAFVRSRSAFLFTSIMAASALFRPQDAALSRRLSTHAKALAQRVIARRHKSVEIVLAFMINVPWMFPGQHSTDDETCWYVAMATTIAIDLSVHKLLIPVDTAVGSAAAVARGDCVDPRTAMAIDGFGNVDPASDLGRRLLRRRERCWIALFVLERGMSLARGRSFTVPITRSLRDCDAWHRSDIAHPMDGQMVSMAVLRRDLDGIFATVRAMCDGSQNTFSDGSLLAQSVQSTIERFFDQWNTDWGLSIGSGPERKLPPYVDILVTHTRLSIYSGVINHPTAPVEVRQFFRTAGMSSALTVMRVAIQGEALLRSMPNNTAIMITFAACFALTLSAYVSGSSNMASSVRTLIQETADVLERIGNVTKHRNGLSALYGRYLRVIAKKAAAADQQQPMLPPPTAAAAASAAAPATSSDSAGAGGMGPYQPAHPQSVGAAVPGDMQGGASRASAGYVGQQELWPGALHFSTMSDEQIVDFLNQPYNAFDPSAANLTWEDLDNFEGLSWPNMPGYNFG